MAMLFNNGSLSIWGFEFEIGVLDYLMNIDEKFIFVKKFDVIDVFELIEKDLGLFWDYLEVMRDNYTKILNSVEFVSAVMSTDCWILASEPMSLQVIDFI